MVKCSTKNNSIPDRKAALISNLVSWANRFLTFKDFVAVHFHPMVKENIWVITYLHKATPSRKCFLKFFHEMPSPGSYS